MRFFDLFDRGISSKEQRVLDEVRLELERTGDPNRRAALQREIDFQAVEIAFNELVRRDLQGAAIDQARGDLRAANQRLLSQPDLALSAMLIIQVAISYGAPIYNEGSPAGCAFIYDYAARLILRLLNSPAGQHGLPLKIVQRLQQVSFDPITPSVADQRAWNLRHAFDDILGWAAPEARKPGPSPASAKSNRAPGRKMVFVSHAKADCKLAMELVRSLEAAAIACWIAPDDIPPGADFTATILEAIRTTDYFLLLLTANANGSTFVGNELFQAINDNRTVIPVRLEDIQPAGPIQFNVGRIQWVDLWPGMPERQANLERLIARLQPVR